MEKKYYRILSKNSSHKGDVGLFVSGFQYANELHYTLKLKNEGFRSYPYRNLELHKEKIIDAVFIDKFFTSAKKLLRKMLEE